MCARHWRMVPRPLQAAVYDSFRREGGKQRLASRSMLPMPSRQARRATPAAITVFLTSTSRVQERIPGIRASASIIFKRSNMEAPMARFNGVTSSGLSATIWR